MRHKEEDGGFSVNGKYSQSAVVPGKTGVLFIDIVLLPPPDGRYDRPASLEITL